MSIDLMRFTPHLLLMLLIPAAVIAHESKVAAEGNSEQFATAEAIRRIPKGASVINTSCKSRDVGMSTRYKCTVTYSD